MNDFIQGTGGLKLHYEQVVPENPIAWVLIVHGWGEHCGRYAHVIERLVSEHYGVITYDQRGHGRSEGLSTYVDRFSDYVDDLKLVYDHASGIALDKPVFILAHSVGGLVTCHFCLVHKPSLRGVILSAASLKVNRDFSPFLQKISGVISAILPKLATVKLDSTLLSRDPAIIQKALKDPLHYKGGIRARTGAEVLKATRWMVTHTHEFTLPVLVLHGGADQIAETEGSIKFHQVCGSEDKSLKVYPESYHEIMNDVNKEEVIEDILTWISKRK